MATETVREAVGVFHSFETLRTAADDLMRAGFARSDLSLLAGHRTILRRRGRLYTDVREIEDSPDIPCRPYAGIDSRIEAEGAITGGGIYVGAVVAAAVAAAGGAEGWVLVGTVALAGLAGGMIGTAVAALIESRHARYIREQLRRGGLLLWVRVADPERERQALAILEQHGARDVHVHDLPVLPAPSPSGVSDVLAWINKPFGTALFGR